MGQLTTQDFVGITANLLTLGISIGLILGSIVRPRRERTNWWFAAFVLTLAGLSYSGLVATLPSLQQFIPLETSFYLYASSLGMIPVTFYFATTAFCKINTPVTRVVSVLTPPALVATLVLLWSNQLLTIPANNPPGTIMFHQMLDNLVIQPAGYIAMVLGVGYLALVLWLLRSDTGGSCRSLRLPGALVLIGLAGNLIEPLYDLPFDIVMITLAATRMGILILHQQIFNPLREMNVQLEQTNQDLLQTVTELTTAKERATLLNEELRTVSQYKSEFLATMSHELRTPLNSIVGYSELLDQGLYGPLNERQQDRVSKIFRNGRDLLVLINDILDLSRIETGHMTLELETLDLADTVDTVLEALRPTAEEKGLLLHTHLAEDLPGVHGDTLRLHQVVRNLVSNAIKFTQQGEITITVQAVTVRNGTSSGFSLPTQGWLKDGQWVILVVQDTGIGIAPEHHAKIFDEFRQLGGTSTRQFGGTGLGLAITKKLVSLHHGSIWVDSAPAQGSTFTVALPASSMRAPETLPGNRLTPLSPDGASNTAPLRILCIDDNPEALDILVSLLREAEFEVLAASSGRVGLELAREHLPDLITTDLMMPGMTGWDVVNQLKANPRTASIPVIVVSIVDQQPAGYEPEVAAHLNKPFTREDLLATIDQVMHVKDEPQPILIVDDDVRTRRLVADILGSAGQETVTCTNGQEALHWLEKHRPRVVLLDLMMPGMNGFEVLASIRLRPELSTLPVLVLSAKTLTMEEQAQLDRYGATLIRKQGLQRNLLLQQIEKATT